MLLMIIFCAGCPRSVELFPEDSDAGSIKDAGVTVVSWGRFVESLPVQACSTTNALVVNTTEDEPLYAAAPWELFSSSAEAGATLSLREALFIAANHPGPDSIFFDAALFPPDAPVTIELSALRMPSNVQDLCLDARSRGVEIHWASDASTSAMWGLRSGSLMIGLTFANIPSRFSLSFGQIAGCRFRVDVPDAPGDSFFSIDMTGGTVGPGNVFAGPGGLGVTSQAVPCDITGNFFGIDPRTGQTLKLNRGALIWAGFGGTINFKENVFGNSGTGIDGPFDSPLTQLIVELNDFRGQQHSVTVGSLRGRIGPGNSFRGNTIAVEKRAGAMVITRNSISQNQFAIDSPVPAPSALFIDGGIGGHCAGPGLVELFSDPGNQAEQFIGDSPCDAMLSFFIATALPSGRSVTATFTELDGGTSGLSQPLAVP